MNLDAIAEAILVLNRIHDADKTVLPALINFRVPCNDAVADDPTVQVGPMKIPYGDRHCDVGLLGIVNGLFGCDERTIGFICARYDADHNLVGFMRTPPKETK